MNTFVLLGLVGLLALFLVRSRRRRTGGDDSPARPRPGIGRRGRRSEPTPTASTPPAAHEPEFAGPPFDTFPAMAAPGPAFTPADDAAPAPQTAPDWTPSDMIVEPGWPLPGEISGAWSAGPETQGPPVATVEPLPPAAPAVHEAAATVAPRAAEAPVPAAEDDDGWEMPALSPVGPAAPVSSPAPDDSASAPLWMAGGMEERAAPSWQSAAPAEPEVEIWRPDPSPAEPASDEVPETPPDGAPSVEVAELPMWRPEPEHEAETIADPFVGAVADPEAVAEPEGSAASAGEPAFVEPEPALTWMPPADDAPDPAPAAGPRTPSEPEATTEPERAAEGSFPAAGPAPVAVPTPSVATPTVDLGAQSLEVAALVPAVLSALRPLVRVSDHAGITPRMLVVMRELAERPLSVGEQAALLGVSRPVIADIAVRMENNGLTRRERDDRDRRRVRVALTDRGRRVADEATDAPPTEAVASALARMAAHEREALLSGLRALSRSASGS